MRGVILKSGVNNEPQLPDDAATTLLGFLHGKSFRVSSATFSEDGLSADIQSFGGESISFSPHGNGTLCAISAGSADKEEDIARHISNVWTCVSFRDAKIVDLDDGSPKP